MECGPDVMADLEAEASDDDDDGGEGDSCAPRSAAVGVLRAGRRVRGPRGARRPSRRRRRCWRMPSAWTSVPMVTGARVTAVAPRRASSETRRHQPQPPARASRKSPTLRRLLERARRRRGRRERARGAPSFVVAAVTMPSSRVHAKRRRRRVAETNSPAVPPAGAAWSSAFSPRRGSGERGGGAPVGRRRLEGDAADAVRAAQPAKDARTAKRVRAELWSHIAAPGGGSAVDVHRGGRARGAQCAATSSSTLRGDGVRHLHVTSAEHAESFRVEAASARTAERRRRRVGADSPAARA